MNFNSNEEVYKYLENLSLADKYPTSVSDIWQKYRDEKYKTKDMDAVNLAQLEMDIFNFTIRDNELHFMWSGSDNEGNPVEYPSLNNLSEESFEHIKNKYAETNNVHLRVRYAHLLWLSPHKNQKYAQSAIDDYFTIIAELVQQTKSRELKESPHKILYYLKNLFPLSVQIKYKTNEVISLVIAQINNYKTVKTKNHFLQYNLLRLINENYKTFKDTPLDQMIEIVWDISSILEIDKENYPAIQMLELGESLSKKIGQTKYHWKKKEAIIYEKLLAEAKEDLAAISYCQQALDCYKQIKDSSKIKELEEKFVELKTNVGLQEFSQEIDLEKYIENCKNVAEEIQKKDPNEILKTLMHAKDILPNKKELEKSVKSQAELTPFLHMLTKTIHDQSGNPIQHFSSENEKVYFHLLENYGHALSMQYIYLIHYIIYTCVRDNKLTIDTVLDFFEKNSWFGKTFTKQIMGKVYKFNWLSQITGSLIEYFVQLKHIIHHVNYYPDLVMPTDSLTLKIEGLVRDLCSFNGITTFTQTKDKNDKLIVKEKDINMLLREEDIEKIFNPDDLLLFKFLLVEKNGYNLRHKVAHGLMHSSEYSIYKLHLLFICLLKIGMYDFTKKNET
jgi:ribosomal 50S subunit-associated protein YjgA (DUF615 family)